MLLICVGCSLDVVYLRNSLCHARSSWSQSIARASAHHQIKMHSAAVSSWHETWAVLTELQLLFWLHESNYGRLLLSSTWTWIVWSPGDLLLCFTFSYSPSVWSETLHLSLCQKTEKPNKQSRSSASLLKTPVAVFSATFVDNTVRACVSFCLCQIALCFLMNVKSLKFYWCQ